MDNGLQSGPLMRNDLGFGEQQHAFQNALSSDHQKANIEGALRGLGREIVKDNNNLGRVIEYKYNLLQHISFFYNLEFVYKIFMYMYIVQYFYILRDTLNNFLNSTYFSYLWF